MLGTAPVKAGSAGTALLQDAIAYAASASRGPGLYMSLDCDYSGTSSYVNSDARLLDGVSGGGFTVTGQVTGTGPACADSGTVNTWQADSPRRLVATSAQFVAGGLVWGSGACPVQESFGTWPANFTPVAYDIAKSTTEFPANYTASTEPRDRHTRC